MQTWNVLLLHTAWGNGWVAGEQHRRDGWDIAKHSERQQCRRIGSAVVKLGHRQTH